MKLEFEIKFDYLFDFIGMGDDISRLKCFFKLLCLPNFIDSSEQTYGKQCLEMSVRLNNKKNYQKMLKALRKGNLRELKSLSEENPEIQMLFAPDGVNVFENEDMLRLLKDLHISLDWSGLPPPIISKEILEKFKVYFPDLSPYEHMSSYMRQIDLRKSIEEEKDTQLINELIKKKGFSSASIILSADQTKEDKLFFWLKIFSKSLHNDDWNLAEKVLDLLALESDNEDEEDFSGRLLTNITRNIFSNVDEQKLKTVMLSNLVKMKSSGKTCKTLETFYIALAKLFPDVKFAKIVETFFATDSPLQVDTF